MNTKVLLATVMLVIALAPAVSATSFITDCQYNDYRTNQSDVVFTGTVTGVEEITIGGPFGQNAFTQISFDVINSTKGDVNSTFTLVQPGHISGEQMIPSLTLEWVNADVYTIQASQSDTGYQLVCGEMGREILQSAQEPIQQAHTCRDISSVAINPETDERMEFNSECNVPRGWTLVTRTAQPEIECSALPVIALSPHGQRQEFSSECEVPRGWDILSRALAEDNQNESELCAQVITYAQNPEAGNITRFPTPCDVPEGWQIVEQPQEQLTLWQRIRGWLSNVF